MNAKRPIDTHIAQWLGDAPGHAKGDPALAALDSVYAAGPASPQTEQAQARLRQALAALEDKRMWYTSVKTQFGRVYFAASSAGLAAVSIGANERDFVAYLRARFGLTPVPAPEKLAAISRQVQEYAAGKRSTFDLPLDLSAVPSFQRRVLVEALNIPFGQVASYREVARRIGRPTASRAVGQALGRNPIPLVIPCHRVLASDGSLRGYSTGRGLRTKAQLLEMEGAQGFRQSAMPVLLG